MRKNILILLLLISLTVVACQGRGAEEQPTEEAFSPGVGEALDEAEGGDIASTLPPVEEPTATVTVEEKEDQIQITPTEETVERAVSVAEGCTVVSPRPTPAPELETLFSPDPEKDWIVGPEDALVTIMEYSDFQ
ncbi:MAG: hypothetical protein PVG14_08385 [Anaerolineales bacterium]|jgi:hypothetical protein